MINGFAFAHTSHLHFGEGKLSVLPSTVKQFGSTVLLVTGASSFHSSAYGQNLLEQFREQGFMVEHYTIDKEPEPATIDACVETFSNAKIEVVVAIGGGSVLDGGKAISAMLPLLERVKDYLEGVGTKPAHPGLKIPFIAVPTTAGTGSEATKNAVLSETGQQGYKRSLRHNNFVPNVAIVDPLLTISCPPVTTATSGMDAFTQLLEAYVSITSNPMTDALAYEGLQRISNSLLKVYHDPIDLPARTDMALAAYLSGIALANAGLGLVHGFASPIGGFFQIPHGAICSALMAPVNKLTVRKLREKKNNQQALLKYAVAGKLLYGSDDKPDDYYVDHLLAVIERWTNEMNIPTLSSYGVTSGDFERIVRAADNKNNPVPLEAEEMIEVLTLAG
jgi:alcohol dehydrogenase class IV